MRLESTGIIRGISLPRVLFVTSPFKARLNEQMIENFSDRLECKVVVPPQVGNAPRVAVSQRLRLQFFGDRSVSRSILDFAPDLIYSDTATPAATVKLACIAAGRRIPFVIHLRGDWWREYNAWFISARWRKRLSSSSFVNYTYGWLSLLNSRRITPICKWLDRVVKNHLPTKPTEVVYHGVDPSQYTERYEDLQLKKPAVAIIQNHTIYPKVKGLLNFKQIVEKLPTINFYIAEGEIFGQSYLPVVREAFSRYPNAHFIKDINNPPAVRNLLGSADAYVLASGLDCCPLTVLEASLMRKPVIASRVGGIPEIVLEDETGWTVRNESVNEWASKLSMILEDTKLRRRIGQKGRQWVTKNFAWCTIAKQVERLIIQEARS